jgi:hypothetical protein
MNEDEYDEPFKTDRKEVFFFVLLQHPSMQESKAKKKLNVLGG